MLFARRVDRGSRDRSTWRLSEGVIARSDNQRDGTRKRALDMTTPPAPSVAGGVSRPVVPNPPGSGRTGSLQRMAGGGVAAQARPVRIAGMVEAVP